MLLVAMSPSAIHGVDFSGAQDAGRRIWISSGLIDRGRLRIMRTLPAFELPAGSRSRDAALAALRSFVQSERGGAVGLDFPFGLPRAIVPEPTWKEFVLAFNGRSPSAEAFRVGCQGLSERELRRATDDEARTPGLPGTCDCTGRPTTELAACSRRCCGRSGFGSCRWNHLRESFPRCWKFVQHRR